MGEKWCVRSGTPGFNINRLSALAGIIAPALFWLLSNIAAILYPGYNLFRQTVSQLVLGPYGWIQTVDFFIVGLLVIAFASGLCSSVQNRRGFRAGIGILFFVGFGTFLLGFFPTESQGTAATAQLTVHLGITSAVIGLFPFACFLLAPSFKADPHWKSLFVYTIATGVLGISLVIGTMRLPTDWTFFGIYERMLLANGLIWIEVLGIRLMRLYWRETREPKRRG